MIPTTNALLICGVFLCGLRTSVVSQHGHCNGNRCFALFQHPKDFQGAKKSCKETDGQMLMYSSKDITTILTTLPSGLNGSYWLHSTLRATNEAAARMPLQNCSSVSISMESNFTVLWKPCREHLNGYLCQYTLNDPCSGLQTAGGAQVRYTAHVGFEVKGSDAFPPGTIAETKNVGAKYPDSKYVCASSEWSRAPWTCEVLGGGCEYKCNSSNTCMCPAGHTLHQNNFTCTTDPFATNPCADCAQGCQKEADTYVCKCNDGYKLARAKKICEDVNECEGENPCKGENEECVNTMGGFECRCKDGFLKEDGECADVKICDKCEHMLCEKFNGVYECMCLKGFRVSAKDPTKCERHCTERDCPATCTHNSKVERADMLQCTCPDGYIIDKTNSTPICSDINECERQKQCDHTCENFFGGYRCLCNKGFKLNKKGKCVRSKDEKKEEEEEEEERGSGPTPTNPTPASAYPAAVPPYIKTGSVLGITVFMVLSVVLLFCLVRHAVKRCGKFELTTLKHSNIDIFYLQQVTTETYKRLSFDKQFKNDSQIS